MAADTTHRPGCPATGGHGHGVEPCICGADTTPVPTDDEIDALIAQHWPAFATVGPIPLLWLRAAFRDGLTRWGAQPAPAASQKPLTDEQIDALWASPKLNVPQIVNRRALARAVEAAHGIKET